MDEEKTIKKPRMRRSSRFRIIMTILPILLMLVGGGLAYSYNYFDTNIQKPLAKLIHVVSRGKDEPPLAAASNDGAITGHSWNILLLGSDDDQKYNFPALLTQLMMVVHIDTVHNSFYMVSIPRDSW